jgi:hypothetical protein
LKTMGLDESQVRRQVERLLSSKALQGSEVHRRLLSFRADKTLAGEGDRLKEYTVALDGLGKPPTYDPHHDSVVRIQVGRLRVKLAEYYQGEGVADPLLITLPKGGFKLQFQESPPAHAGDAKPNRLVVGLAAAVVLLALAALLAGLQIPRLTRAQEGVSAAWNAELSQIWAPFLGDSRPLVVCIGAPMFMSYPSLAFIRDPGANTWDQLATSPRFAVIKKALPGREPIPWFSFTGVGEATGAFELGQLLGTRRRNILVTRSNLLSWAEIAADNVVFLGPPKMNTQLQGLQNQQEITLETNGIRIHNPRPNEPSFLHDEFEPGPAFNGVTHALISCTPGPSGQGDVLVLGGNAGADTTAAVQWVTQPWRARELVNELRTPSGTLPRYYQAVISVQFKNGTPVESSYVLHRAVAKR